MLGVCSLFFSGIMSLKKWSLGKSVHNFMCLPTPPLVRSCSLSIRKNWPGKVGTAIAAAGGLVWVIPAGAGAEVCDWQEMRPVASGDPVRDWLRSHAQPWCTWPVEVRPGLPGRGPCFGEGVLLSPYYDLTLPEPLRFGFGWPRSC